MTTTNTRDTEILSPEEARMLINDRFRARGSAGVRDCALLTVLYLGGLRIAEALALREQDVDLATGDITIHRGKGHKRRQVRLPAGGVAMVERWIQRRRKLNLDNRHPLFCTISKGKELRRGKPLYPSQVRNLCYRLRSKLGIAKRVHPHGFRHTYASELIREGQRLDTIKSVLGHSSIATTERYLHTLHPEEHLRAVGDREFSL